MTSIEKKNSNNKKHNNSFWPLQNKDQIGKSSLFCKRLSFPQIRLMHSYIIVLLLLLLFFLLLLDENGFYPNSAVTNTHCRPKSMFGFLSLKMWCALVFCLSGYAYVRTMWTSHFVSHSGHSASEGVLWNV